MAIDRSDLMTLEAYAKARPALRAAASPRFFWLTQRARSKLAITLAVSSVEPSSTTMIS